MAVTSESSPCTLYRAFAGLILLLALTALGAKLAPGPWSLPLALGLATAKVTLIFLYFMRLRWQPGMVRIFALAGFFWLVIAGALTLADYLTRGWHL